MSIFSRPKSSDMDFPIRHKPFPKERTPEAVDLLKRLRKEVFMKRGRRVELSVADTIIMRAEMVRENERREWEVEENGMPMRMDDPPFPFPEDATEIKLRGVPCFLDRPETKVVVWDDREQWLTLAATCYTPELSP